MILLNNEAVEIIKNDRDLFNKIMVALSVSERTMYNYVAKKSNDLTKVSALNELVEHTQRPLSELVTSNRLSKLLSK